jgi:predicted NBD/HSP70 family sugar kinase
LAQQPTREIDLTAPAATAPASRSLDEARDGKPALAALPEKATHQQTRTFNQQLVLRAIYDRDDTSRAEIARLTGLTRTSVSGIVGELLRAGLVQEIGRGPSSGGKAPILLSVAPEARFLMGIDLGENVFRGAIVNLRGEIVRSAELPLDGRNGDQAVARVLQLIDALRNDDDRPLLGIGIAAPGLIDSRTGTVRWAVNLDWANLPLGPLVADRYGVPVVVMNDSQAAALAELAFHRRLRPANLLVIRVGRGIGAGVILDGDLYQGDGFGAGEIGHFVIDPAGEACRCGRQGCLETVASTRAVLQHLGELAGRPVSIDEAVAAFNAGDGPTNAVVLDAGERLGQAVGALIGALNVRRIVLAGSMAAFGEPWLAVVREAAGTSALAALTEDTTLELGGIEDIVVLGASALLMTPELGLTLRPVHPVRRLRSLEAGSTEALDRARDVAGIVPAELVVQRGGRGG